MRATSRWRFSTTNSGGVGQGYLGRRASFVAMADGSGPEGRTGAFNRVQRPCPTVLLFEGVEFLEFAADSRGAVQLGKLLRTFGFFEAGRHISKDVTLFSQDGINIVVNTERQGLAHSSYIVHGTSAYAIGLKVDSAAATVARATALGAEVFDQPVGRGELSIPAIRGVGGGVIYFLDDKTDLAKVWDIEFTQNTCVEIGDRCRTCSHRPCRSDDDAGGNAELAAVLRLHL